MKETVDKETLKEIKKAAETPEIPDIPPASDGAIAKVEREINRRLKKYIPIFDLSHLDIYLQFVSQKEIQAMLEDEETQAYAAFILDDLHGRLNLMFENTLSWLDDGFTTNVVLLHELMHVKLYNLRAFSMKIIEHKIPADQQDYFYDQFREIEEATVDSLARAIDRLAQTS